MSSLRRSTCLVASSAAALAAPASSFRSAARDLRCSLAVGVRTCAPAAAALVMSPSAIAAPSCSHATVPSLPLTRRATRVPPPPPPPRRAVNPARSRAPFGFALGFERRAAAGALPLFRSGPEATAHPREVSKRHRASTCQPCDVAMITRVVLVYQYTIRRCCTVEGPVAPVACAACLGSHWRVHVHGMGVVARVATHRMRVRACARARRAAGALRPVSAARAPRGTCACWCTGR